MFRKTSWHNPWVNYKMTGFSWIPCFQDFPKGRVIFPLKRPHWKTLNNQKNQWLLGNFVHNQTILFLVGQGSDYFQQIQQRLFFYFHKVCNKKELHMKIKEQKVAMCNTATVCKTWRAWQSAMIQAGNYKSTGQTNWPQDPDPSHFNSPGNDIGNYMTLSSLYLWQLHGFSFCISAIFKA